MLRNSIERLVSTPAQTWLRYIMVYCAIGFVMNGIGTALQIAKFANWWQVITCYGLYLVPASLLVRHLEVKDQYLCGLAFLAILELGGYSLGTSIPFDNNIIDLLFTERNFSLVMTIFFAAYLPAGNKLMDALDGATSFIPARQAKQL